MDDIVAWKELSGVGISIKAPIATLPVVMQSAIHQLIAALAEAKVAPAGPMFCYYSKVDPMGMECEVCFPVEGTPKLKDPVHTVVIPAQRAATRLMEGDYSKLPMVWGMFWSELHVAGLPVTGKVAEIYRVAPDTSPSPADWRTELYAFLEG